MVNIIRRFQQPLMITITVLVIVSFVIYFNKTQNYGRYRTGDTILAYGRPVSRVEFEKLAAMRQLAAMLRLNTLMMSLIPQDLIMAAQFGMVSPEQIASEFAENAYVVRHEADKLGIRPTQDQVFDAVQKIPAFQTNNQFDPTKFNLFITNQLGAYGSTFGSKNDLLEAAVADDLRIKTLQDLIGGSAIPTPEEVRARFAQKNQKTNAAVVRFPLADFKQSVAVTDDDVKKAFEEKKDTLRKPDVRTIQYVDFSLPTENPPQGADRKKKLEELADQASDMSAKLTEKNANFDALAASYSAPVKTPPPFAENQVPEGLDRHAAQIAFNLTTEQPNSDPQLSPRQNGYYIIHLQEITPGAPLTFEEAKPQLTEQIKSDRAKEAMNLKSAEANTKIQAALKEGKTFEEAAEAAGVKA